MTELKNSLNLKKPKEEKGDEFFKKAPNKKPLVKIIKIFTGIAFFLTITFFLFTNRVTISEQADSFIYKIPIIGQIRHLAKSSDRELKGEESGRINILLLGIGGKGHDGGLLTDTIMIASLDVKNKKAALLSIPRDMSIPLENENKWTKINNINAYAEVKETGSGGIAISQAISDILEIPIDYYLRVDFEGFTNVIDKIGGVNVLVENNLDDYRYPILGQEDNPNYDARFEYLHLEKGWTKMNGELALKYARSRHASGIEGSDFARARRQQIIIAATKEQLLKTGTLLNPITLTGIINELSDHVSTNLKAWEIIKLWTIFKNIGKEDISTKVLDNSANGLLQAAINDQGVYVLLPKNGDFSEIKYLAQNIFSEAPKMEKEKISTEQATLEIMNGTWINGLANRASVDLEKYGFNIIRVSNSSRQNFEKSVIYDLSFGEKIKSLSILKEKTGASATFELPEWLKADIAKNLENDAKKEKPDFILVLGQDADKTNSGAENKEQE